MFGRYVALGDSTTEGIDDPRPDGTYRGWADRLAERLAPINPDLLYAKLAVRGRPLSHVRAEEPGPARLRGRRSARAGGAQPGRALALEPDLATVVAGLNDLLRRRYDPDAAA